jgi:diketogulonate reductase-like aldo/keto reductase
MSKLPAPILLDGSPLPPLIYGTTINESPHRQPSLVDAVRHGYRGIDTASTRKFHNEALDGDRIRAVMAQGPINREALLIQTKYTSPSGHPDDETTWPYSIEDSPSLRVLRSVGRSTDDLKGDVIDVYLLHRILDSLADTVTAWKSLEKIVGVRAIRYLGICNVGASDLQNVWDAVNVKPSFVQNRFIPGDSRFDVEVVRFCLRKGIVYQVFGLLRPENRHLLDSSPVRDVAKLGFTEHQALIRVLLEAAKVIGLRICIVNGTTSEGHMVQSLSAVTSVVHIQRSIVLDFIRILGWDDFEY